MWLQGVAQDRADSTARAGTPPNQITFEMLTGARQFDTIEAQIQSPPLLHEQWKTVVLGAWYRITPQREPTGSYTKTLQGPLFSIVHAIREGIVFELLWFQIAWRQLTFQK